MLYSTILASFLFATLGNCQSKQSIGPGPVPSCAAAMCQDQAALVTVLDTVWRGTSDCVGPPFVLRTLHAVAFSAGAPRVDGSPLLIPFLPRSPVLMRMEDFADIGGNPFRRYWREVRIVDTVEALSGAVPSGACLFAFSPVVWMGMDSVRVEVVELRHGPARVTQRFVFLLRRSNRWKVTRVEVGMQS